MIDISKKYRTRDGREVRVLMTDGGDWNCPVIAAYKDRNGYWWPLHLTAEGRHSPSGREHPLDLIEIKPRIYREVWVNVYAEGRGINAFQSRESADECACAGRIACVKVTIDCEEGEGL